MLQQISNGKIAFKLISSKFSWEKYTRVFISNQVTEGLKVKQNFKPLPTLKMLMQTILVGLWVKNFTFSILSSLKQNFHTTFFAQLVNGAGNIRNIVNFSYPLKIYTNYQLTVIKKKNLKIKILEIANNSYCRKQLLTLKT